MRHGHIYNISMLFQALTNSAESKFYRGKMRFLGLLSLVALIFLLSFRSLIHQQVLVGEGAASSGLFLHEGDRRRQHQHAREWEEERKKMRWFMVRDYAHARRHTPRNNRLDP
uniref:Uncharacterized protein n=1 Tax=Oryza brachyantha TaxID=4533 RepID=J3LEF5_ORYBR